ncbi:GNAT family N-acetyltransferase [uncultured Microbulbifer sp.]|uniref:GNAT family N-acetyltransferase n=1 Tax=uncultured Microbulbifer sp. TaxID=348147 RepID=UPI002604A001|nr:GNAT family N-acetyltransferase [uncultured Microbulbifer sp.]
MKDILAIKNMCRSEIDILVDWADHEGWNPGRHDAEVFWETDPEAFIAAEVQQGLIGAGSIASYGGNYGFMGFFIIKPEYRGFGFGRKLWYLRRERMLERLRPGASVGLDAAFQMQNFYAKGGFVFSHRNLRFCMEIPIENKLNDIRNHEVLPLTEIPFTQLLEYDTTCFSTQRARFLRAWLCQKDSRALGLVQSGELRGYALIRRCRTGFKVGPLFANTIKVADSLLVELASFASGNSIFLDVPENNPKAMELTQRYNMKEIFGCARMYLGSIPNVAHERIFGVTTFELG